ncbi:hypothetical protein JHK85_019690 [Glycine max]|nr:hypothetical protein JHK85_019690 [Glycine max]
MTALVRRAVMKLSLQFQTPSSLSLSPSSLSISKTPTPPSLFSFRHPLSHSTHASKTTTSPPPSFEFQLFIPPGIEPDEVDDSTVLPGSNIAVGPYAGHSHIKDVQFVKSSARFVKSSARARDCPKDNRPEFAVLGKTQLINHFLVNKSWYLVDLPGYGFAKAPEAAKTDWSSFTKGYFLNKSTLVAVLLLIDASVPPQKIDLDCANWLGRNNIPITFVFTKCDKMKVAKGKRPDENIRDFQELIRQNYKQHPPWIMTSSATGMGRDELLLHMSQLRNYWDQ